MGELWRALVLCRHDETLLMMNPSWNGYECKILIIFYSWYCNNQVNITH